MYNYVQETLGVKFTKLHQEKYTKVALLDPKTKAHHKDLIYSIVSFQNCVHIASHYPYILGIHLTALCKI